MTSANDALEAACLEGDASACLDALARGADPEAKDHSGWTAMHTTTLAGGGALRLFGILLEHGADPRARNAAGETPLHLVCNADTLIDFKCFTGATDDGRTSFYVAAIVEMLVRAGAQVNARANDGSTPLHRAAEAGASATVMALLHAGAEPTARDASGRTPVQVAGRTAAAAASSSAHVMTREHLVRLKGLIEAAEAGAPNAEGFSLCGAPARGVPALAFLPPRDLAPSPSQDAADGGGSGADDDDDDSADGPSWAAALAAVPTSLPVRLYGEPPPRPSLPPPPSTVTAPSPRLPPLSPSRKRAAQHINIAAGSPSAARRTQSPSLAAARKAARRGTDDLSEGDENAVADDELGIETFVLR